MSVSEHSDLTVKHRADVAVVERPVRRRSRASQSPGRHLHPAFASPEVAIAAHMIPVAATWKSHHLLREMVCWQAVGAAALVLPATAHVWRMPTPDRLQTWLALILLTIGMWSVLVAHHPRRVLLAGSLLTIEGERSETFDLADSMQEVELSGDPRKHDWHLVLDRGDAGHLMLNRRDVDPIAVDIIVRHYREVADRRAAQRWAMLGLQPA